MQVSLFVSLFVTCRYIHLAKWTRSIANCPKPHKHNMYWLDDEDWNNMDKILYSISNSQKSICKEQGTIMRWLQKETDQLGIYTPRQAR